MSSQLKRVNYSIYLNPVHSLSDRYAVGIMQKWVNERKSMLDNPDAGMELHNSLHMHKNIYLSGMFLHLLSPALTAGLSTSLGEDTVKMATLKQQLDACGLMIPMEPGQAQASEISRQDLDAIKAAVDMTPLLSELQSLRTELRQANDEHVRHVTESSDREKALLQSQQNTQQELMETRQALESLSAGASEREQALLQSQQSTQQELTETRQALESLSAESSEREQTLLQSQQNTQQELEQTRQVLESLSAGASEREQAIPQSQPGVPDELTETCQTLMSLSDKLAESVAAIESAPAAPEPVSEGAAEPTVGAELPDFSEFQQALTDEIRATNHKREIAELKALIKAQNELIKKLSVAPAAGAAAEKPAEEEQDLTETIANMQKVKKKGLW